MSKTVKCPVREIAAALRNVASFAAKNRPTGDRTLDCDVRLQIFEGGSWALHSGSSDYDQDHSGVWGSNSVPLRGRFDSMAMARALWNQAVDMAVDGFDGPALAYSRPSKREYVVQGHYGQGWDDLTSHETWSEARVERRVYDANEAFPHRVVCRRVER